MLEGNWCLSLLGLKGLKQYDLFANRQVLLAGSGIHSIFLMKMKSDQLGHGLHAHESSVF